MTNANDHVRGAGANERARTVVTEEAWHLTLSAKGRPARAGMVGAGGSRPTRQQGARVRRRAWSSESSGQN
jgi:hypothetical protein